MIAKKINKNRKQNPEILTLKSSEVDSYQKNVFKGLYVSKRIGSEVENTGIRVGGVHKDNIFRPKNQRPFHIPTLKHMAEGFIEEAGFVVLLENSKKKGKKVEYRYEIHDGQHRALSSPNHYVLAIIVPEKKWKGYELWDACNDAKGHKQPTCEDRFWNSYHGGCAVANALYDHLTKKHNLNVVRSAQAGAGCYVGVGNLWKHMKSKTFSEYTQPEAIRTIKNFSDIVFGWFDVKDFILSGTKSKGQAKYTLFNEIKKAQDDLQKDLELSSWMSAKEYLAYVFKYAEEKGMGSKISDWSLFRDQIMGDYRVYKIGKIARSKNPSNKVTKTDTVWLKDSLIYFFRQVHHFIKEEIKGIKDQPIKMPTKEVQQMIIQQFLEESKKKAELLAIK